jgi:hypothetical protein
MTIRASIQPVDRGYRAADRQAKVLGPVLLDERALT